MKKNICESQDRHRYYDYLEDYSAFNVFDMVMNGENLWTPLINPMMYKKALDEFIRFGHFIKFPTKYIYQWMGIIMKNTAILHTTTDIAGHSPWFPESEFFDYFFGDEDMDRNGISWEEWKEEHGYTEDDYESITEYLDEVGFYDNLTLPDGSDAWSDFGLQPIEECIYEYNEDLPPEKVITIINRILDIYHQRGDLSSAFIEGGRNALSQISNGSNNMTEAKIRQIIKEVTNRFIILENKTPYDYYVTHNGFRYKMNALLRKDGYVIHGTNNDFDEFDTTKIKRGVYGYGIYFANMAYKSDEYMAGHFKIADINDMNLLKIDVNVDRKHFPMTDNFDNKEKLEIELAKLTNLRDNSRNIRDYDFYESEIKKVKDLLTTKGDNDFKEYYLTLVYHYLDAKGSSTIDNLNKYVISHSNNRNITKEISNLWLNEGYDGFYTDSEIVIFNFEKLSKNIIHDVRSFINQKANEYNLL